MRRKRTIALASGLLLLSACAELAGPEDVSVRHFPSNEGYGEGRLHLFVFQPQEPRPLAERIRIARRAVSREAGCRWIDAPDKFIAEETRRQGELYADTLLVAPLRCA